uniref:Velvet domain-containing protein n=1 Tax=Steinernema glaseri TaxID=37863 RepID=A0A1I7YY34_9BILA
MNDSLYLRTPRPYGMHSRNYKFMNGGAPLRHASSLSSVDSSFVADIPFESDDVMSSSYHSQSYYPNPHHFYHHQQHQRRECQYYRDDPPPYHQFPQPPRLQPQMQFDYGRRERPNVYQQMRERHPQQQQYYENVYPYERPKKPTADEFLEKLRRHKAELQQRQSGGYGYQYQPPPPRKPPTPLHHTVSESVLASGAANDYVPKRLITPTSQDVKFHSYYGNPQRVEMVRRPASVQFNGESYDNVREYLSPSPPLPRQRHSSYSGIAPAAPSPFHAQIQPAAIRRQGSLQNLAQEIQNYSANSSECDYNEHWPKDPFETTRRVASPRHLPLSPPPVHHSNAVKVNGFQSNFPQVGRAPTPQGILAKNGHGEQPRSQKKVVFQCDADLVRRLSFEIGGEIAPQAVVSDEAPPVVRQYDDSVDDALRTFLELCTKIGGEVSAMSRFSSPSSPEATK